MIEIAADDMGGLCGTWETLALWEDIIKTYLRKRGGRTWIEFSWLDLRCKWRAVVHLVMNLR